MGIEYIARYELIHDEEMVFLRKEIIDLPGVEYIPDDYTALRLRYTNSPYRPEWPDDLQINLNPQDCCVLFHAGGKPAHYALLGALQKLFARLGRQVLFVDVSDL